MPSKDKGFVSKDGKKTYGDEQEELKKAFLEAVEREGLEDGEEDFFIVKEKVGNLNDVIVLQAETKAEEAFGVTTGMILSLHERYYRCEIYYTLLRLR